MVVNRFLLLFGPNFNFSFECWSVYCNLDINCLFVFHVTLPPINIKVVKSHFTPLNPNFNQFVLYEYGRWKIEVSYFSTYQVMMLTASSKRRAAISEQQISRQHLRQAAVSEQQISKQQGSIQQSLMICRELHW